MAAHKIIFLAGLIAMKEMHVNMTSAVVVSWLTGIPFN